jgi:hypothetical protein
MFKQELLQSSDNFKEIYKTYRKATDKYIKKQDEMLEAVEKIIKDKYPNIYDFQDKFFRKQVNDDLKSALDSATELLTSLYACKNDFKVLFAYDKEWASLSHYLDSIIQSLCFKYKLDYSRFAEIDYITGVIEFWHRRLGNREINNVLVLTNWIKDNHNLLVSLYSIEISKKPIFKFEFDISELSEANQKILRNIPQTDYLSIECY